MNKSEHDFFISYTRPDQVWAEWIAWQLEEAGYSAILQAWDFLSGHHFVREMHRATLVTRRTIAVLSKAYIASSYAEAEWQKAWRSDPQGIEGKLLVFRIEDCTPSGLLGQLIFDDLFGVDEQMARSRVLTAARRNRRKPLLHQAFQVRMLLRVLSPFLGDWC